MKKRKRFNFIYRIRNRQFQRIFFRNWRRLFLCIALPLILSIGFLRYFSEKSLLREMDAAAGRSTDDTVTMISTLLEETCNNLQKQIINENVTAFLRMERKEPQEYNSIAAVNAVQKTLDPDYRQNLYASMDVYTQVGDYVISVPHKGQAYSRFADKGLVETFFEHIDENRGRTVFAYARYVYNGAERADKRVLTFYWVKTIGTKKGFVSISVDTEKLIEHITDNRDRLKGSYLIVDRDNRVILDTAGQMNDQYVELLQSSDDSAVTAEINGQLMRISWAPMDLFGWRCVQMVPMEDFEYSSNQLNKLVLLILLLGVIVGIVLSYDTTCRMYRPVEAILQLLENPSEQLEVGDEDGELRYMLVSILELFQKNMTLEQEMVDRVVALRRARAKALQEQMMPHFLNNVLQSINWITIMEMGKEDSVTSRSLILLADILGTAKAQKNNFTTVAEEIVYTRKFVELECLRYGPGIHCICQVDPAAQEMLIPCISLQTLVENSISHGLQPLNANGNIYITIRALEKKGLYICVEDDGIGIEQATIDNIFQMLQKEYIYMGEHLGIVNLFQRFRLIYGETCEFEIRKSEYGGACVEIRTPEPLEGWVQGFK